MKYTIVIDAIYLYYIIVFNIVEFKVKVVLVIGMFFVVSRYSVEIDSYWKRACELPILLGFADS